MADLSPLSKEDMDKIHAALTNAGIGEGSPGVAKLSATYAKQSPVLSTRIFCNPNHYCIIVKDR